jgi:hypothetical protein
MNDMRLSEQVVMHFAAYPPDSLRIVMSLRESLTAWIALQFHCDFDSCI